MPPGRDRGGRGSDRGGRGGGGRGGFEPRGGRGGGIPSGGGGRGRGGGGDGGLEVYHIPGGTFPAPDVKVTQIEDATQKQLSSKTTSKELPDISQLTLDQRFPNRPGYGTKGAPIVLWANYFQMMPKGDVKLYRYAVDIVPDPQSKKKRKRLIELLRSGPLESMQGDITSDYQANLVCRETIPEDLLQHAIVYRFENEDEPGERATTYKIRLEATGSFTVADLIAYLTSTNANAAYADKLDTIQALNIVTGQHPKASPSIMSVGASRHYPLTGSAYNSWDLGAGLQALRGYFVSVRTAASRILVNVQVKNAAVYEAGELGQLMRKFREANPNNLVALNRFLEKVRVETTHLPVKKNKAGQVIPKVKVIAGLATKSDGQGLPNPPQVASYGADANNVKFFLNSSNPGPGTEGPSAKTSGQKGGKKEAKKGGQPPARPSPGSSASGRYVTVADFFKKTYGLDVKAGWPVVNVGNRANPSYLPVDVCKVIQGQQALAQLSPDQTAQMINFAVRKPFENARSIAGDGLATLGMNPQCAVLKQFGMSISNSMITVPGRILTGPNIKYRDKQSANTRFGSWNMNNIKFTTGAALPTWTVLFISDPGVRGWQPDDNTYKGVVDAFTRALNTNGVIAQAPIWPGPQITVTDQTRDAVIDDWIGRIVRNPKQPRLILVILPKADPKLYNRVKYCGDVVYGIHTVCVVGSKFGKPKRNRFTGADELDLQYFANVALKFNLKLGGVNQSLETAKLGVIAKGKTMVVGIDVTHPSPGSASNAPSIASMVASVDSELGQWPAVLQIQTARQEMVSNLGDLLKTRLRLWQNNPKNREKALPANILVYRDGVSEGQYEIVLNSELPLLRDACEEVYPATQTEAGLPKISIIVVGKRHHTRFYPTTTEANKIDERSANPKNGTVVDRGVTEARNWDFFLQAHTALQGTARPAHYFVVHDEIFPKEQIPPHFQNTADVLEDLTHNMCYMFGRATKAVSICPPAYYADLVCTRARCYLSPFFDATPGVTPATSTAGGSGRDPDASQVLVHSNLRNTMFYI